MQPTSTCSPRQPNLSPNHSCEAKPYLYSSNSQVLSFPTSRVAAAVVERPPPQASTSHRATPTPVATTSLVRSFIHSISSSIPHASAAHINSSLRRLSSVHRRCTPSTLIVSLRLPRPLAIANLPCCPSPGDPSGIGDPTKLGTRAIFALLSNSGLGGECDSGNRVGTGITSLPLPHPVATLNYLHRATPPRSNLPSPPCPPATSSRATPPVGSPEGIRRK
jgi:hypothetical protein